MGGGRKYTNVKSWSIIGHKLVQEHKYVKGWIQTETVFIYMFTHS